MLTFDHHTMIRLAFRLFLSSFVPYKKNVPGESIESPVRVLGGGDGQGDLLQVYTMICVVNFT